MGKLIDCDANLFKGFFKEMAELRGIRVEYKYPLNDKHYSTHTELETSYSNSILTDIIFQEYPTQKTLRKLGWFSENMDDKPYIAQVASDLTNLQQGCLILIPTPLSKHKRVFRVTEISNIMQFPDSFIVRLVPEIQTEVTLSDKSYENTNYNYLNDNEGEE